MRSSPGDLDIKFMFIFVYGQSLNLFFRCEKEKKFALASMVKFMTRKCQVFLFL